MCEISVKYENKLHHNPSDVKGYTHLPKSYFFVKVISLNSELHKLVPSLRISVTLFFSG